jgi:iron complex outermembrane recepter protein
MQSYKQLKSILKTTSILAAGVAIAIPTLSMAQQADVAIEEILVTAQKREQSLQDVPIAITAFTGETQKNLGWSKPIDILAMVPNMSGQSLFGTTQPTFFIRGIGTSDQHHSAQSPVGFYSDDTYIGSTVAQGFQLFDLERVEVLRGPQGTLWGKNTTGGAIHFVSARPTHESKGYAAATYGLYNDDTQDVQFEGMANTSLVKDVLAARASVQVSARDGWVKNTFNNTKLEELTRYSGRTSFVYTPTENFEALLNVTLGRQRGDHVVLHHVFNPQSNSFLVVPYREGSDISVVSQDHDSPENVDYSSGTLHLTWDLPFGDIKSISGFGNVKRVENADVDASPFDVGTGPFVNDTEQRSQEFRITSKQEAAFRWILGAFYFHETIDGTTSIIDGPDGFGVFCPRTRYCTAQNFEDRKRESYAGYGSIDYDLTDQLTFTGGLRFTEDSERLGLKLFYYDSNGQRGSEGVIARAVGTPFKAADRVLNKTWSKLTGDATMAFKATEDLNLYAKYSRGYLAGTHVIPFVFPSEINTLEPEEIIAYEAGIKSEMLDGSLQLRAAGFYYDYSNIQVSRIDPANSGTGVRRENAATAKVKGGELELTARPTENFFVSGGLGYTDATYNKFLSASSSRPGQIDNFSGNRLLNTPKWTANGLLLYSVPLAVGSLELQTDWVHQGQVFFTPANNNIEIGEKRTIGNVAVRYVSDDASWKLTAFARNVLNTTYIANERNFSSFWGLNLRILGAPRVIGAKFEFNF